MSASCKAVAALHKWWTVSSQREGQVGNTGDERGPIAWFRSLQFTKPSQVLLTGSPLNPTRPSGLSCGISIWQMKTLSLEMRLTCLSVARPHPEPRSPNFHSPAGSSTFPPLEPRSCLLEALHERCWEGGGPGTGRVVSSDVRELRVHTGGFSPEWGDRRGSWVKASWGECREGENQWWSPQVIPSVWASGHSQPGEPAAAGPSYPGPFAYGAGM